DRAGVGHAGTARSPAEAAKVDVQTVRGVRVGLLDYTYGLNSGSRLPEAPWAVNFIDPARILRDARAARQAGAAFVVVQLHWGEQYQVAPTAEQRSLARRLLASPDVDLIVGGHVHVVQPVERIGGKYVVYGVGNFLSNQSSRCCPAATQDGVIVTAHVERTPHGFATSRITFTPTWVDIPGYRVLPVAASLDDPATPAALRPALRDSWRRTVAAIGQLGPLAGDVRPDRTPR
ncbi:MAG TPA: CapA family protein, partial [Frankiaceae bacterium]|nr:CapA family protein [Frankiaceae bacterium]